MEDKTIKEVDEAERMWKWCQVYEKTLDHFRWTQKDRLMMMRYHNRNGVMRTCIFVGIERRTYFYWLDEILHHAFMWAEEYELF